MRTNNGFTIVEILIAVVLIVLLMTMILPQMFRMYRVNGSSSVSQRVVVHAKTVMETIQSEWADNNKFKAGTLPTLPPAPSNITCDAPVVTTPKKDAYVDEDSALRKRVKLTCTLMDPAEKKTFNFVQEFGGV